MSPSPKQLVRYPYDAPCPCCGFPTIHASGKYDICIICWWLDNGSSDETQHIVDREDNGKYSLFQARQNYKDHGHKYDAGEGVEFVEKPSAERIALMEYIAQLGGAMLKEKREDKNLHRLFEAEAENFRRRKN